MNTDEHYYDSVVDAIDACAPGFCEAHAFTIGRDDLARAVAQGAPDLASVTCAMIAGAIRTRWAGKGVRFAPQAGAAHPDPDPDPDPVARELLKSVSDTAAGFGADASALPDVERILADDYESVRDSAGTLLAYRRRRGGVPLLLLNAFGIPLRIWHRLLAGEHGYQVIVPVLPNCDPVHGGMQDGVPMSALAAQLRSMLDRLDLADVSVLAWCNAGRLALALLELCASRIRHVVLLAPTLRGNAAGEGQQSPFENNLAKLFKLVRGVPKSATAVAAMLGQRPALPDWPQLAGTTRAAALFGLPRRALCDDLSRPMATADSLVHYAARTHSDEAISAGQAGYLPACPITLVQGEQDAVVSNAQARDWLRQFAPQARVVTVSGAGHYIQDLQFAHLLFILDRVLAPGQHGEASAVPARLHFL
jgi:pimeloyl-ACP methyl ester carboxylesterase